MGGAESPPRSATSHGSDHLARMKYRKRTDAAGLSVAPGKAHHRRLERRRERHVRARRYGEIFPRAPAQVVDEKLEDDGSRGLAQHTLPFAVAHTVHQESLVPAQPRTLATHVERVAEANVDLCRDRRHDGLGRHDFDRRCRGARGGLLLGNGLGGLESRHSFTSRDGHVHPSRSNLRRRGGRLGGRFGGILFHSSDVVMRDRTDPN